MHAPAVHSAVLSVGSSIFFQRSRHCPSVRFGTLSATRTHFGPNSFIACAAEQVWPCLSLRREHYNFKRYCQCRTEYHTCEHGGLTRSRASSSAASHQFLRMGLMAPRRVALYITCRPVRPVPNSAATAYGRH